MLQKPIHPIDSFAGKQLRQLRHDLGITQEDLAAKLGGAVTFQQLQKYERGINRLSTSRLWDIAEALDVPVIYFFPPANDQSPYCHNCQERHLLEFFRKLSIDKQSALLAFLKTER